MISPGKTREGALVGLLGGAVSCFFYLKSAMPPQSLPLLLMTCILASLFSQVGDLFESMLKRHSGVKDSGKILPGHGGILDRIDGLLFAGPIIYLWMVFSQGLA
jgi:phosphatidate cytidylyltransferase